MIRFLLLIILNLSITQAQNIYPSCPHSTDLQLISSGNFKTISNGKVCLVIDITKGNIPLLQSSFEGDGNYGRNVLKDDGITLEMVSLVSGDNSGSVLTTQSSEFTPTFYIVEHSVDVITIQLDVMIIVEDIKASESWLITLTNSSNFMDFQVLNGILEDLDFENDRKTNLLAIERSFNIASFSITGFYDSGPIQMKDANDDASYFSSNEGINRLYSLGDTGGDVDDNTAVRAFNGCLDIMFEEDDSSSIAQTILISEVGKRTNFKEVVIGVYPTLERWTENQSNKAELLDITSASNKWKSNHKKLAPNNHDFPLLSSGTSALNLQDQAAFLTGIYASPVGCLCTHTSQINDGESLGQIATTIARPDRGYSGTYNYFDP